VERRVRSIKRWKDANAAQLLFIASSRLTPGELPGGRSWTPAALLRALRRGAGRSQAGLAADAGVRQKDVSAIETGKNSPRWATLVRLIGALGAEPLLLARSRGWTPGVFDEEDDLEDEWTSPEAYRRRAKLRARLENETG